MSEHEKLLAEIERFLDRTGMAPSTFSLDSCGQRNLMIRLRNGEGVTLKTVEKVRSFMRNYSAKKKPSNRRLDPRVQV